MMNDIAKAWVAALRSDEYQQMIGGLVSERDGVRRYCCLGVAYTVIPGARIERSAENGRLLCKLDHESQSSADLLTDGARIALGLADSIGSFSWESLKEKAPDLTKRIINSLPNDDVKFFVLTSDISLAALNDAGVAFPTIADVIEAEPEGLFDTSVETCF